MRKIALLLACVLFLGGCGVDGLQEQALDLRSQCLASGCTFQVEITADYIDTVEEFTLDCSVSSDGVVSFSVAEPEEIQGITGTVSGQEGALTFDDQILGFPLMADERLSPVSGPWIVMKALRSGYIKSYAEEDGLLHLTLDDSYADDALTVDLWTRDGVPVWAEVSWQGRRALSMEIEQFRFV